MKNKHLIRKGMRLRRKHIELFQRMGEYNIYDYIKRSPIYLFEAKESFTCGFDIYDPKILPNILYTEYLDNPLDPIRSNIIDQLSYKELWFAFLSGYLKHDTRGYYFTRNTMAETIFLKRR